MRAFNESVIEEFRANGGVLGGRLAGTSMLLLTTVGARSGLPRTSPLACVADGGDLVVFASNLGSPRDPEWFRNLVACPDVTVEVGTERFAARATAAEGAERERLYDLFVSRNPGTEGHQAKAGRPIPMVVLRRIG
ncbi:nitroreductase/quinone reductase family protein [Amycolatopsis samaneae]|uniref:Nitroreductase/quinone reductase family protein n=1 Tax=Amycolatopsis samaneae TaxID=664691 RepID=A0ABW5GJ68_9PSEU